MISQNLVLTPKGNTKSGRLNYYADTTTGLISYTVQGVITIFWLPKSFSQAGSVEVDPKILKSENITEGTEIPMGAFDLKVVSVKDKKAQCSISVKSGSIDEEGTAVIDLSGEFISIESINADGKVFGLDIPLEAQPA